VALVGHLIDTEELPGDIAEFGVWLGGSAIHLAEASPTKTLHLFDTFDTGTPWDDEAGGAIQKGAFAIPLEVVKQNLAAQKNVIFHPGIFPETTLGLGSLLFSFVHVDVDIYQSAAAAIDYFWPRMVHGGVLVFDDFNWKDAPGIRPAVYERLAPHEVVSVIKQQCFVRCHIRHYGVR